MVQFNRKNSRFNESDAIDQDKDFDDNFLDEDDDLLSQDPLDEIDGDEEQINEVRYIDPTNLNKYSKDEIEEVTTASGEKRYKRKSNDLASQPCTQQNAPAQKITAELNRAYTEPENEIDKYSGHNSIKASVPVAKQTLMDLADKFNGTYNKSKKRVEFKKNSDMQKAIKALRELPAGRFNYVFSSNYFGDGYQVKPKDYNVESSQKNESYTVQNVKTREDAEKIIKDKCKPKDFHFTDAGIAYDGKKNIAQYTPHSNQLVIFESAQINETRGYKVLVELGVPDNMNNRDIEDEVERLLRASHKIDVVMDVTAERH